MRGVRPRRTGQLSPGLSARTKPRQLERASRSRPSPLLTTVPVVDFLLGPIFCITVTLLQATFELLLLAVDHVQIVVRQLAPLLLDLTFDLLPIALHPIPI